MNINSRQRHKTFNGVWYVTIELVSQYLSSLLDEFGLVVVKADLANKLIEQDWIDLEQAV